MTDKLHRNYIVYKLNYRLYISLFDTKSAKTTKTIQQNAS